MATAGRSVAFSAVAIVAASALATTASAAAPATQPALVRVSNGDFIGLFAITRYVEQPDGHLYVMLVTDQSLTLTEPGDVDAVRRGLGRLNLEGRLQLFWPAATVAINLDQVTNVWNDSRGFTFWGTDGRSWIVADGPDSRAIWDRLRAQTLPESRPAVPLVAVGPSLLVNPRHVARASMVDGKLQLLMSNATLPIIEAEADVAAAQRTLAALAAAKRE